MSGPPQKENPEALAGAHGARYIADCWPDSSVDHASGQVGIEAEFYDAVAEASGQQSIFEMAVIMSWQS